jgi:hypothetical protein
LLDSDEFALAMYLIRYSINDTAQRGLNSKRGPRSSHPREYLMIYPELLLVTPYGNLAEIKVDY